MHITKLLWTLYILEKVNIYHLESDDQNINHIMVIDMYNESLIAFYPRNPKLQIREICALKFVYMFVIP